MYHIMHDCIILLTWLYDVCHFVYMQKCIVMYGEIFLYSFEINARVPIVRLVCDFSFSHSFVRTAGTHTGHFTLRPDLRPIEGKDPRYKCKYSTLELWISDQKDKIETENGTSEYSQSHLIDWRPPGNPNLWIKQLSPMGKLHQASFDSMTEPRSQN